MGRRWAVGAGLIVLLGVLWAGGAAWSSREVGAPAAQPHVTVTTGAATAPAPVDPPAGTRPPTSDAGPPPTGVVEPEPAPSISAEEQRRIELDRQRGMLRDGVIARFVPSRMSQGDNVEVVVRVSGGLPPSDLVAGLPTTGVRTEPTLVGSDLNADLSGGGFEISRVGSDDGRRLLGSANFVEWRWNVRPIMSGEQELQVVLYVRLLEDGLPIDVRTFVETVAVSVSPGLAIGQWFQDYGAATGISVPVILGGLVAAIQYRRSRRDATDTETEPTRRPAQRPPRGRRPPVRRRK